MQNNLETVKWRQCYMLLFKRYCGLPNGRKRILELLRYVNELYPPYRRALTVICRLEFISTPTTSYRTLMFT